MKACNKLYSEITFSLEQAVGHGRCMKILSRRQIVIHSVSGGKFNILGGHSIGESKKKVYINMCPFPNGFRYLARSIFLPSLSMSNHNSQLTLHAGSHASDIGTLRWEGQVTLFQCSEDAHVAWFGIYEVGSKHYLLTEMDLYKHVSLSRLLFVYCSASRAESVSSIYLKAPLFITRDTLFPNIREVYRFH
jgi:hypothetical protein